MPANFDASRKLWLQKGVEIQPRVWGGTDQSRPSFYNCQIISLDCSTRSPLRWNEQEKSATACLRQGIHIVWDLQSHLTGEQNDCPPESLLNATLRAFTFFHEGLYSRFASETLCTIIDRDAPQSLVSTSNFLRKKGASIETKSPSENFSSDLRKFPMRHFASPLERFERKCAVWRSLSAALAEDCPIGVLLDLRDVSTDLQLQLIHQERLEHLLPIIDSDLQNFGALTWNRPSPQGAIFDEVSASWADRALEGYREKPTISLSIALPILECGDRRSWEELGRVAEVLQALKIPHRVLALRCLRDHWEELDDIIAYTSAMTQLERRQLDGFCAAGGRVIGVGKTQLFTHQLPFGKWVIEKIGEGSTKRCRQGGKSNAH